MFLVESVKFDIKSHMVFYLSCINQKILGCKEHQITEKQTRFCANLLTLGMHYDIHQLGHITNQRLLS